MNYEEKFHQRLQEAFEKSGQSLERLSEQTGIDCKRLEVYLTEKLPSARALTKLCVALHVKADYLLSLWEYAD